MIPLLFYYYYVVIFVSLHMSLLSGTSEQTVISTTQSLSFRLQYILYYVLRFKYSCHLLWIELILAWYGFQIFL
jgi:hypothetical protein